MASIITDITEGSIRRDAQGWHATRICDLEDSGGEAIAKPYTAAIAVQSVGVSYGEPHPVIPGIRVSSISVEHVDREPDIYRVTAEYSGDESGSAPALVGTGIKGIEVSTSTFRAVTNRDINGELMQVTYQGREIIFKRYDPEFDGVGEPVIDTRVQLTSTTPPIIAEYEIPTTTVVVTREQSVPSHVVSGQLAGTVNVQPWSGLAAYKWLLLGIDSQLNETGTYDWRYIFAIAPSTTKSVSWRFRAEVVSPFEDRVYTDATLGNGIADFDVYRPINFEQTLGFSIPS